MSQLGGQGSDREEWERVLRNSTARFRSWSGRLGGGASSGLIILGLVVLVIIWMGTGIYTVSPDEKALVRRFGAVVGVTGEGLNWHLPSPIARHDKVKVTKVQRMEVGFRTSAGGVALPHDLEALMITGDENIVDVEMVVLYRVFSIEDFLLRVRDPGDSDRGIGDSPDGRTLKDAAEVALRGIIGSRPIDDVLTAERGLIEAEVKEVLQRLLNIYETGLLVQQVQLQTVRPPGQVQQAFDDVVSAKEDKERFINEAQAFAADIVPRARGDAERMLNEARAFEATRVNEARGRANEFLSILEEYLKAPEVTRQRMYLEAMEEILPQVNVFIIDSESGGGLLQFLPLEKLQGERGISQ